MLSEHLTIETFDLVTALVGGVIVSIVIPVFRYWIKKIESLDKRVSELEKK